MTSHRLGQPRSKSHPEAPDGAVTEGGRERGKGWVRREESQGFKGRV